MDEIRLDFNIYQSLMNNSLNCGVDKDDILSLQSEVAYLHNNINTIQANTVKYVDNVDSVINERLEFLERENKELRKILSSLSTQFYTYVGQQQLKTSK
jgi:hypothetical protein